MNLSLPIMFVLALVAILLTAVTTDSASTKTVQSIGDEYKEAEKLLEDMASGQKKLKSDLSKATAHLEKTRLKRTYLETTLRNAEQELFNEREKFNAAKDNVEVLNSNDKKMSATLPKRLRTANEIVDKRRKIYNSTRQEYEHQKKNMINEKQKLNNAEEIYNSTQQECEHQKKDKNTLRHANEEFQYHLTVVQIYYDCYAGFSSCPISSRTAIRPAWPDIHDRQTAI
eukprot:GHVS01028353.1.p1 GENE.GHVS01028353.1~~GHVS01028353.1.p1  ORF type:complete len:228 (+),score=33.93 GHVS01028353.1:124-807(+)